MSKPLTVIFFLIIINPFCQAQNLSKIDKFNILSFELRSMNRDSSRNLAYKALALSKKENYIKGISQAQLNLGIHYCNLDELDSASFYLNNSYQYWQEQPSAFYLAINYWYLGKLHQKINDFPKAFVFLGQAEQIFKNKNNRLYQIYVLTEQGVYCEMQDDYPKALSFFLKAYKLRELISGTENSIQERSNIASVYAKMGKLDEALRYGKLSLDAAIKANKASQLSVEFIDIGKIYQMNKEYDSAIYYYNKALLKSVNIKQAALQSNIFTNIASVYNELSLISDANTYLLKAKQLANESILLDIYLQLGENYKQQLVMDSSMYYLSKCISLSKQRGSKKYFLEAAGLKMSYFEQLEYYDSAFYYSKLVKQYSDLLYNEKKDKRFNNLRVQLGLLEKEKEIEALKLTQYQSKIRANTIITVSIIIINSIIIVFIVFKVRQKRKNHRLEIQLEKSKKKLSAQTLSMVHRNNAFEEIQLELIDVRLRCNGNADPGLQKIQNVINLNKSLENDWDNFSNYFTELHINFFEYLEKKNSELSDYELRLCALIKLKLTNKEIATILNIEHKSVKMAKYRLKRKLDLSDQQTLSEFISRLG